MVLTIAEWCHAVAASGPCSRRRPRWRARSPPEPLGQAVDRRPGDRLGDVAVDVGGHRDRVARAALRPSGVGRSPARSPALCRRVCTTVSSRLVRSDARRRPIGRALVAILDAAQDVAGLDGVPRSVRISAVVLPLVTDGEALGGAVALGAWSPRPGRSVPRVTLWTSLARTSVRRRQKPSAFSTALPNDPAAPYGVDARGGLRQRRRHSRRQLVVIDLGSSAVSQSVVRGDDYVASCGDDRATIGCGRDDDFGWSPPAGMTRSPGWNPRCRRSSCTPVS